MVGRIQISEMAKRPKNRTLTEALINYGALVVWVTNSSDFNPIARLEWMNFWYSDDEPSGKHLWSFSLISAWVELSGGKIPSSAKNGWRINSCEFIKDILLAIGFIMAPSDDDGWVVDTSSFSVGGMCRSQELEWEDACRFVKWHSDRWSNLSGFSLKLKIIKDRYSYVGILVET